jgi:hypothetical protein
MVSIWKKLSLKPEGSSIILKDYGSLNSVRASASHWGQAHSAKISIRKLRDGRLLCTLTRKPGTYAHGPAFREIVTLEPGAVVVIPTGPGQTERQAMRAIRRETARAKGFEVVRVINGLRVRRVK